MNTKNFGPGDLNADLSSIQDKQALLGAEGVGKNGKGRNIPSGARDTVQGEGVSMRAGEEEKGNTKNGEKESERKMKDAVTQGVEKRADIMVLMCVCLSKRERNRGSDCGSEQVSKCEKQRA